MKKYVFVLSVMLALVVGIGNIAYAAESYIPITEVEIMPPRSVEKEKPNSVCWQVYPDPTPLLRPQIFGVNGGTNDGITQSMLDSLATIRPKLTARVKGRSSYGFTCRPAGWTGFVQYEDTSVPPVIPPAPAKAAAEPVKVATAKLLPKIDQPAQPAVDPTLQNELERIKAELALVKAAEKKRLAGAVAVQPKAKPVIKKQPAIPPLAACQAELRKTSFEKENAEKSLSECQTALTTTKDELKAAGDKLTQSEKNWGENIAKAKLEANKIKENMYYFGTVVIWAILGLILGLAISLAFLLKKRKNAAVNEALAGKADMSKKKPKGPSEGPKG